MDKISIPEELSPYLSSESPSYNNLTDEAMTTIFSLLIMRERIS